MSRRLWAVAVALLLGAGATTWAAEHRGPHEGAVAASAAGSSAGYSRAAFGPSWADTDHNGCDQRNDVLARDLTGITIKPDTGGCVVLSGTLADPYTGRTIAFQRGKSTSAAVQIDHRVPLSWAWQHGASAWTPERREQFATDLSNLQATDGPTNEAKGDEGPDTWLPPDARYDCEYVARFAQTVSTYGLSVDASTEAAFARVKAGC